MVKSAVDILEALGVSFERETCQGGLAAIDECHDPLPPKARDVVLTQEVTAIRPGVRACFIRGPQGISVELLQRDTL